MRRPYEIMADCELGGFPTSGDVGRVGDALERARRAYTQVVRATVVPPAAFRDGRYILPARFLVWAEDASAATRSVEQVIAEAGLSSRVVLPTGRALAESDVPPAPEARGPATKRRAASTRGAARAKAPAAGKAKPRRRTAATPAAKGRRAAAPAVKARRPGKPAARSAAKSRGKARGR
ncbi:MAG: hypothetical protein QN174_03215 [Armatimonadota bacterium]|nr:hypothetical protein [Armatimonadota bacterium]MDR7456006.1 hypothetical protein [Armatimonadota bacterium]MDR7495957.1 hypothetical protein [Armatimonadota bacterium]MDR7511281.1 hypothetical protein [Armatimonadota bacterium]